MGVELKLIIGSMSLAVDQESIFMSNMAEIDLCKVGSSSKLWDIDGLNKNDDFKYYYHNDNSEVFEDGYSQKFKPVKIQIVIRAIRESFKEDPYCRYRWALSLLEEMESDYNDLKVILYWY